MNNLVEAGQMELIRDIPDEILKLTSENNTLKKNIRIIIVISIIIVGYAAYKTFKSHKNDTDKKRESQ